MRLNLIASPAALTSLQFADAHLRWRVSFSLSICVLVNKMDTSNTLESSPAAKTEVDDLMGSENMLALDDMLESLSDDVLESSLYSEIFDTVL